MAKGYKKKLYTSGYLNYIGVSDESKKEDLIYRVKDRTSSNNVYIILDNDSHCIEDLNSKFMWINGEKLGIDLFKEALIDYDISVFFHNDVSYRKNYIEGIYVRNLSDETLPFLKGSNNEFVIKFSPSLNSFIGDNMK